VLVREHVEKINAVQRYFVDSTRLGIPIIPFEEALHGLSEAERRRMVGSLKTIKGNLVRAEVSRA